MPYRRTRTMENLPRFSAGQSVGPLRGKFGTLPRRQPPGPIPTSASSSRGQMVLVAAPWKAAVPELPLLEFHEALETSELGGVGEGVGDGAELWASIGRRFARGDARAKDADILPGANAGDQPQTIGEFGSEDPQEAAPQPLEPTAHGEANMAVEHGARERPAAEEYEGAGDKNELEPPGGAQVGG